jgi:phosphomannomutase
LASELIISVSGLRGVVGESLTPEVAKRYATAFAAELPPGPIVLGRDGRASGPMLAGAIAAALIVAGRDVLDFGAVATPTVGVLVRDRRAAGGIQISASHNPPQYNGMKLFSGEGRVIPAAAGQRVLERFHITPVRPDAVLGAADESRSTSPTAPSLDSTTTHLALIERIVDVDRIRSCRFPVLLDANHGAGAVLGRPLLELLGCQCVVLGETPDGQFEHTPEPTANNLSSVLTRVSEHGAAIGFCQDPDADRLAIIDEKGRYLGEEYTLALCVDHVLRSGRLGPIVTNCSTSRMSEDLAAKYGVPFFRSIVGEANVVDVMLRENAVLGGEGNGGAIDPRVGLVRDSFVGMALALDAMASRDQPVSALAAELPRYAIHKTAIAVAADHLPGALAALERHFSEARVDRLDGLRFDWQNRAWLLVRPSNTEPIVRAIAEAPTAAEAESLCRQAAVALSHG